MDKRIEDLEVKVSFQEHTIAELNEVVRAMADQIDDLRRQLKEIRAQVENDAPPIEDAKPPHY